MAQNLVRFCMVLAGPVFAVGLFLMQPQITALAGLEGSGRFMRSLAMEGGAWRNSHILLVAAGVLYIGAGIGAGAVVARRNVWAGGLIGILFTVGFAGLMGNFALDFVYGALASSLEEEAAQAARTAILSDSATQILFVQGAAGVMLLGMLALSLSALITGWAPRLTGVLIIAGWAIVLGLNSIFPYAEVIGHAIVGIGFWPIALVNINE